MKARDEGKGEAVSKQPPVVEEPRHTRNPPPPTHGYSRYDQERFRGKEGKSCDLVHHLVEKLSVGGIFVVVGNSRV